eukprot:2475313-Rhodomonas_salina.2
MDARGGVDGGREGERGREGSGRREGDREGGTERETERQYLVSTRSFAENPAVASLRVWPTVLGLEPNSLWMRGSPSGRWPSRGLRGRISCTARRQGRCRTGTPAQYHTQSQYKKPHSIIAFRSTVGRINKMKGTWVQRMQRVWYTRITAPTRCFCTPNHSLSQRVPFDSISQRVQMYPCTQPVNVYDSTQSVNM